MFFSHMSLLIIGVYHPFWDDPLSHDEAINCITDLIDYVVMNLDFDSRLRIVLLGDFNDLRYYYKTISHVTHLKSRVSFPTRGEHVLDQLFTNIENYEPPQKLPPVGRSDHCCIVWLPSHHVPVKFSKVKTRKIRKNNIESFRDAVCKYDWCGLVNDNGNIDESCHVFIQCLFQLFNAYFPLRTVRVRADEPPWMRLSLKILINDRDAAFKNKQKLKYLRLCNEVRSHIKYLKSEYLQSAVKSKNPKTLWNAIDILCNRKKVSPNVQDLTADDFSSYFSSVFQSRVYNESSFDIECLSIQNMEVSVADVLPYLRNLKRKSCGPDGLPYWVFRDSRHVLAPVITILFNRCLNHCIFPECFKVANVCPIPKTARPNTVNDFRPISMLPILSKVFEKIICDKWLVPSIRDKVQASQFAYVPGSGKGPVMATTTIYLNCLKFLDQKSGCVRMTTVDLKKAFDRLTHSSIVQACIRFELSKNLTDLIVSFLSNRKQRVLLNQTYSSWAGVTSGVPQGSVLGPILFCMVIDDLAPLCPNSTFIKYADDLTILHSFRNECEDNLQQEIDNVFNWCRDKSLDVNLMKSNVMNIVTKRNFSCNSVQAPNGVFLSDVPHLKILGCHFSSDLKWDKHVEIIVRKASKRIHLILSLKRAGCSTSLLFNVYCTCIRPILLYCFPTVCNMPKALLKKLLSVEKRVLRIIGPCNDERPSLLSAADLMCSKTFQSVANDPRHPLRCFFDDRYVTTRNACPLKRPRTKTKRFLASFVRYCP